MSLLNSGKLIRVAIRSVNDVPVDQAHGNAILDYGNGLEFTLQGKDV